MDNKLKILKQIKRKTQAALATQCCPQASVNKLNVSGLVSPVVTKSEMFKSPLLKAYYKDTLGLDDSGDIIDIDIFKVKHKGESFYFGVNSDFLDKEGLHVLSTPIGDVFLVES